MCFNVWCSCTPVVGEGQPGGCTAGALRGTASRVVAGGVLTQVCICAGTLRTANKEVWVTITCPTENGHCVDQDRAKTEGKPWASGRRGCLRAIMPTFSCSQRRGSELRGSVSTTGNEILPKLHIHVLRERRRCSAGSYSRCVDDRA